MCMVSSLVQGVTSVESAASEDPGNEFFRILLIILIAVVALAFLAGFLCGRSTLRVRSEADVATMTVGAQHNVAAIATRSQRSLQTPRPPSRVEVRASAEIIMCHSLSSP